MYSHYSKIGMLNKLEDHYQNFNKKTSMIPEQLDPYETLGVTPQSSYGECQSAFPSLINRPSRKVRIGASSAYDTLCNSNKYIKKWEI